MRGLGASVADDSPRERIAAAIAADPPGSVPGAMLNGWVLVAEWVSPDNGELWLTRVADDKAPSWRTKGMLYESLSADWAADE